MIYVYYYEPELVFEMFSEYESHAVLGNHDEMLLNAVEAGEVSEHITKKYGHGLTRALDNLHSDRLAYLRKLPQTKKLCFSGFRVLLAHGTPWDKNTYVYPDADESKLEQILDHAGDNTDLIVLGHTHHQCLWNVRGRQILNPGSVGQPRDRRPGAAWAVVDTDNKKISLLRAEYDHTLQTAQALKFDPELPYLREVFTRR